MAQPARAVPRSLADIVHGSSLTADPLRRFWEVSWPLFRAAGVRVRVHWTSFLVPAALFAWFVQDHRLALAESVAWSVGVWLAAFVVIWTHEMAHVWAGRGVGVQTSSITLSPLGGIAHLDRRAPSPPAEIWIALAGPLAHAVWFVLVGAPYVFLVQREGGEMPPIPANDVAVQVLQSFLAYNAALLFVNLVPIWPTDMGRALRGMIARRRSASYASLLTSYVGFAGAVVLGLVAVGWLLQARVGLAWQIAGASISFGAALVVFAASRRLLVDARWGSGPYDVPPRAPRKAVAPPSWSLGSDDETPAEPVVVENPRATDKRRLAVETQRRREPVRAVVRPLQERIDELLDRINEVGGIENLSDAERRELSDASERLRRGDR